MSELKPCPFCGRAKDAMTCREDRLEGPYFWIRCCMLSCGGRTQKFPTIETAQAAWNRRPDSSQTLEVAEKSLEVYALHCNVADEPFKHKPILGSNQPYSECLGCRARAALSSLRSPSRVAEASLLVEARGLIARIVTHQRPAPGGEQSGNLSHFEDFLERLDAALAARGEGA